MESLIRSWALELGFQEAGIAGVDLGETEARLQRWLALGRHGDMEYMARHGSRRSHPPGLVPGTRSILSVRLDYMPEPLAQSGAVLRDPARAFVSRYALGRDYHKLIRKRLQALARRIEAHRGPFRWRAFSDSAPVMEKPIAARAGLGWIGRHTNLVNREAGSFFFLGELYTDLELTPDPPAQNHCGNCRRCLDICPTQALVAPYELDARLCISYLTIEHPGPIPERLRPLLGNRIYGCDDCQQICPWNRFARLTAEADFLPRQGLDRATLLELWRWDEDEFLQRTQGSAIRRIGHVRWLRNLAVALGNSGGGEEVRQALAARLGHPSVLVREHVRWALSRCS